MPDAATLRTRAALLALVTTLAACEPSTSEPFLVANLALAPRFEAAVARAPIAIDQARVTVIRGAGTSSQEVVVEETVPFPADEDELTISLKVPLQARSEQLTVTVDLFGGGQRYFTASDVITVFENSSSNPASPDLTFSYVGPGANATVVIVTPRDTALSFGDELTYSVAARDAQNQPVTGFPVTWSTDDPQVPISDEGTVVAPTRRTTIRVIATLPNGVSGNADLTFVAVPTSLEVTAGADQTGTPGAQLASPFVVLVKAADGLPVEGVPVTFSVVSGGGSVGSEQVETNGSGLASTTIRLGSSLGTHQFRAEVEGLEPVTITATAAVGPPFGLRYVSGGGQLATPGATYGDPLVVEVVDADGNPVPDATVTWSITPGGSGSLGATTTDTDLLGRARMTPTAGQQAGITIYNATLSDVSGPVRFPLATVTGPPNAVQIFAGGNRAVIPDGPSLPMEARVVDIGGNPVPNIPVNWQILAGAPGQLETNLTTTDEFGIATNSYQGTFTPNSTVQVRAAVSGGPNVVFSFPVTETAGFMLREQGDGQTTVVNQTASERFMAILSLSNSEPFNAPVVWDITSGGGTLLSPDPVTGSFADATAGYRAPTRAGPKVIRVRHIASGAFMNFNVMALPAQPAAIMVASGDNQIGSPGSSLELPLQVIVLDQFINPVPDVLVFWNRIGGEFLGTSTTGPFGFASRPATLGSSTGDQQFQASIPGGLSVTFRARSVSSNVKAP